MNIIEHPRLYRLLATYSKVSGDQLQKIEDEVWDIFGQSATVLVIDMSGFSKITKQEGIIYYLSLIKRMQDTVAMAITRHHGTLIKFLADNAFVIFDAPQHALNCIEDIHTSLHEENALTPDMHDIRLAAGIDAGQILNINNTDMFGDPVNIASLLGEDTAEAGQVMMTRRAFDRLDEQSKQGWKMLDLTASGVDLKVASKQFTQ